VSGVSSAREEAGTIPTDDVSEGVTQRGEDTFCEASRGHARRSASTGLMALRVSVSTFTKPARSALAMTLAVVVMKVVGTLLVGSSKVTSSCRPAWVGGASTSARARWA
jgi:hypothetical protein